MRAHCHLPIWILLLGIPAVAFPSTPDSRGIEFFESRIRPVLVESCYGCHSVAEEKKKGGLHLDSRESLRKGGDSGPAINLEDPAASLLLLAIRHAPDVEEMPPDEKLPSRVVADMEKWIAMGAPDPRDGSPTIEEEKGIDMEEARRFWSFQPIGHPKIPDVSDQEWPAGAVDRFILSKLEAMDLRPAPGADRETLLRRVTLALTGLPPSIEDQDAFLADESADAFEKVVDRLLESRAFAERWGRHWLDISRYSDTSGGGRAMPFPDAWRFRDYVIDSFDRDKPLDQMIREQIAGDLLPSKSREEKSDQITATGFLVLGPHNYENQDKELLDLEIVDEQIDTLGRAFLGMTIGCARCHDHKFDPIPTRDYYAMAGIFLSTKSVVHSNVSKWTTRALTADEKTAAAFDEYTRKDEAIDLMIRQSKAEIARLTPGSVNSAETAKGAKLVGIVVDDVDAERIGDWKESTVVQSFHGKSYHHDQRKEKGEMRIVYRPLIESPGRFEVRISYTKGKERSTRVPVAVTHAKGKSIVKVNQQKVPEHGGLFQTVGSFDFAKGEATITISNDGTGDGYVIADAVQLIPESGAAAIGRSGKGETGGKGEIKARLAELNDEIEALTKRRKNLAKAKPPLPVAMGVLEGAEPADTQIRIRGMTRKFGEMAPRGFLSVIDESAGGINSGSGRLELADWVASPENPLTARVLVNRFWLHLFGEGIVRTPDNFGLSGQVPSHPELLDFLAQRLIFHGWSAKKTIREMVMSRAWQMASRGGDPSGDAIDPSNELLWRARRPRMDAESFRDSVLTLSGNLDTASDGPSLPKGFKSEFGYKFKTERRSVYIPVFRNRMHEVFSTFDFANPNFVVGKRSTNAVPTQSLFLMNSDFIHGEAIAMAERLNVKAKVADDSERMNLLYREILCRFPRPGELELSLAFLEEETAESGRQSAWAAVIRGLFSCVDFLYVH